MVIPVTDLRSGVVFKEGGKPYKVIKYTHSKIGRGGATIKVKVKNLLSGAVTEKTFSSGSKVEEAEVTRKKMQYLFRVGESATFMEPKTYEQLEIRSSILGDAPKYLAEGKEIILNFYEGEPIGADLPPNVALEVTYAEKGAKGDSATNVSKPVKVETGIEVQTPLFIKKGDVIKVDTRTGEYVERMS